MQTSDLARLKAIYSRDITTCPRCKGRAYISTATHPTYGDRPYAECPSCRNAGLFPWGIFLVGSDQ